MIMKNKINILTIFLIGFSFNVAAQRDTVITQEVEVVKTYNPTIRNADKIIDMPVINEEERQEPKFNYTIKNQPFYSTLSVNTIKAVTLAPEPEDNNGFGLVRAGFGNYNRPYGELFLNSRNTKNTMFVLHGRHLSSLGKLKLKGGDKVKAPFSENEANMFIKHLYRQSVLSFNLNFRHNGFNYYGYPMYSIPPILQTENQNINYLGTKQAFSKGGININLKNENSGTDDIAFDFNFIYQYFGTKTGQREHFGEFATDINKPLTKGSVFLNLGATYVLTDKIYNHDLHGIGRRQQTWLAVKPAYYIGSETANIKAGFNVWYVADKDQKNRIKIAPNIRANFVPVKEIINIYVGVDGKYINNHYSKIAYENPFVNPEHDVKNTFEKLHFYGRLDGKLTAKTNFKISADYSKINDQPLFYLSKYVYNSSEAASNHEGVIFNNDFNILYDDLNLLKLNAEIFHTASKKLDLFISGNYFIYKMKTQYNAWNLPDWEGKISLGYKVTEQLSVNADAFFIGKRKALVIEAPNSITYNSYNLNTVFDMNFNADYKITQKFSTFIQLNNFGFQKYEMWFGYPVQSFNFLGGISYSF